MEAPDVQEGDVLWIEPAVLMRTGCPNGFPFRAVRFLGRGDGERVWVRGVVLSPVNGSPLDETTILVPPNQQRAVRRGNAIRSRRTDEPEVPLPVATAAVPAPHHARRYADNGQRPPTGVRPTGTPPSGYRRIA